MSLVVLEDVSLHLGGKKIVEDLGLRVADGDRIGLIGPNGSGKSTLLRLLCGEQMPDGGLIRPRKGVRIGYLPQDVHVDGGLTLMQFVRKSVPGRAEIDAELAEAEGALTTMSPDEEDYEERMMELAARVAELHERSLDFERLYSDHEAKRILAGLGFTDADHDRDLGELSGGWKMRAVLCSLLFQRPDLLLLDEPTNHLDMPSVAWLSGFLQRYDRAFVLISHDREFLDEQIARVVSFEVEGVRQYTGNYERYLKQRAEERILLENRAKNLQREKEQMERFIKRFRAKASKAKQVQSRVKQLEKMEDIEILGEQQTISFRFPPVERAGKTVLEVDDLAKSYGDHEVLRGVSLRVARGDRIALLGVNGAGKTTLLRTLAGEIEATGGSYEFGHKTKVGYYAQHHAETLDRTQTIYDSIARCAKDAGHQQVRAVLGAMLFGDREIDKLVGVLSGGERARVALAQILIDPGNVLLMDEPTNHLDLASSERLADAIDGFEGTLLFVSHNRAFIRRLAKKIWFVEDGRVVEYPGTFDDYLAKCRMEDVGPSAALSADGGLPAASAGTTTKMPGTTAGQSEPQKEPPKATKKAAPRASREEEKARKRAEAEARRKRRPLERRSKELEQRIETLEAAQAERTEKLQDPAVYEDPEQQKALATEMSRAQAELEVAMETWTEVQEELEKLRAED